MDMVNFRVLMKEYQTKPWMLYGKMRLCSCAISSYVAWIKHPERHCFNGVYTAIKLLVPLSITLQLHL